MATGFLRVATGFLRVLTQNQNQDHRRQKMQSKDCEKVHWLRKLRLSRRYHSASSGWLRVHGWPWLALTVLSCDPFLPFPMGQVLGIRDQDFLFKPDQASYATPSHATP